MKRSAFTLLELILALALTVFAVSLIGTIMRIYANDFATKGEDIRRMQLARSLLNMIADDIRSVLTQQEYDGAVLEQLMGSAAAGGTGTPTSGASPSMGSGTGSSGSTLNPSSTVNPSSTANTSSTSSANTSSTAGGGGTGGSGSGTGSGTSMSSTGSATGATATDPNADLATTATAMPLGLYGSQYQLLLDASRLPRPDEYYAQQQNSILGGTLVDVPGDVKTICYYVQSPTNMGVNDQLAELTGVSTTDGMSAGLVRRRLDRAVSAFAEEQGQMDQLLRTGDLVAPEVVSIEFSYFDGTQWLTSWDSSTQSMPWLIQITLAMQSARGEKKSPFTPGTPISLIPLEDRQAYGIEVYDLVVAIPGAQLQAAPTSAAETDAGLESVGL